MKTKILRHHSKQNVLTQANKTPNITAGFPFCHYKTLFTYRYLKYNHFQSHNSAKYFKISTYSIFIDEIFSQ